MCVYDDTESNIDTYYSVDVWLRVQDASGSTVFSKPIDELNAVQKGSCYQWSGDWDIPSDIGGQSGDYTFEMRLVSDIRSKWWCDSDSEWSDKRSWWPETCVGPLSSIESATFNINAGKPEDRPPDADIRLRSFYSNPTVGDTVEFTAEDSTDDQGIKDYAWFCEKGCNRGDPGIKVSEQPQLTYTFENSGEHKFRVQVQDTSGQFTSDSTTVYVEAEQNQGPTAVAEVSDSSPSTGKSVTFSAAQSSDPDGDIVDYQWSIGRTNQRFDHIFQSAGSKTVRLTVTDDDGATATDTVTVNVQNPDEPPTAEIELKDEYSNPTVGDTVEFTAQDSTDDNGIESYNWFCPSGCPGDSGLKWTREPELSYTFEKSGVHTFRLEVNDAAGQIGKDTVTVDVGKSNRPPEARIEASNKEPAAGEEITLTADQSSDPDGSIQSYEWSFGGIGETVSHSFDSEGSKEVQVVVRDDSGATDTASVTIDVQPADTDGDGVLDTNEDPSCVDEPGIPELDGCPNTAPEISNFIVSKSQVEVGEQLTAEVSASDPDSQQLSYSWTIPETNAGNTAQTSFSFKNTGTKTVTVQVSDGIDTTTESQTVTVVEPEPGAGDNETTPQPPETNETGQDPGTDPNPGDGTGEDNEPEQELGPFQNFVFTVVDLIGGIL